MIVAVVILGTVVTVGGLILLAALLINRPERHDPIWGTAPGPAEGTTGLGTRPPEIAGDRGPRRKPGTQAPTRGVAQGRAVRVRARGTGGAHVTPGPESRPAARAGMTGSLTPRPLEEDPGPLARGGPGPKTPPARTHPPVTPAGEGPGAAAAAGPPATPPAHTPPALPDPAVAALAAQAAAHPETVAFEHWQSDTFVGGLNAIKDGGA